MTGPQLVDEIQDFVANKTQAYLAELPLCEMASLTEVQALGLAVAEAAGRAVFAAWSEILIAVAKDLGLDCPCCGRRRKCKTRPKDPLRITVLGMDIELPKLYLECGHCHAPGVSITKRGKPRRKRPTHYRELITFSAGGPHRGTVQVGPFGERFLQPSHGFAGSSVGMTA